LNEHIFAMALDVSGRLLAGISGDKCRLVRFETDKMEIILEPQDAKYIFAIDLDEAGNIYVATGPQGKVYQTDPLGKNAKVVYQSKDKNILSLAAGKTGLVYAGSDGRGLVYKIEVGQEKASVLYDSEQSEIAALLFGQQESLWAAGTSAKIIQTQTQFASQMPLTGRPESPAPQEGEQANGGAKNQSGKKLEIPNTEKPKPPQAEARPAPVPRGAKPGEGSCIYKITKDGFVTDVFAENAVFFCLAQHNGNLLVGTGNNAQLFAVDPVSEEQAVLYEDKQATQITAIAVAGDDVYLGTANAAKLIKLGKKFRAEGTYTSDLVDAGQPAQWGKLHIEAELPAGCKVLVASRSGNVADINDPSFSDWTPLVEVSEPVQLSCPLGRYCQYKLVLNSSAGDKTAVVREVAVASTVPNLAPKVEAVGITRIAAPAKEGFFKIDYKASDDNADKLVYKIDFRKLGRTGWVELKDDLEAPTFEWDGKTVEDGRYEIRVTACDRKSNSIATALQGSRISDPVVVDNTGPEVLDIKMKSILDNSGQYKALTFKVVDQLSVIGNLEYTIDSNADWKGCVSDDLVLDTMQETFTVKIPPDDLPKGDHVITLKAADIAGNTTYKTYEVTIE